MKLDRKNNKEHYSHQSGREKFLLTKLQEWSEQEPDRKIFQLNDKLKSEFQDTIIVFMGETKNEVEKLIHKGQFFGETNKMKKGIPSACHQNTANFFLKQITKYKIATGYALSEDAVWRSHSWLLENNQVVETTEPRLAYYGIILKEESEIEEFLDDCIL